ncbi:MAG: hypothetical protein IPM59_15375 [Chloracidobacterium sp.]|nr:hypothetical protein [Chloracidobacterium sp.]
MPIPAILATVNALHGGEAYSIKPVESIKSKVEMFAVMVALNCGSRSSETTSRPFASKALPMLFVPQNSSSNRIWKLSSLRMQAVSISAASASHFRYAFRGQLPAQFEKPEHPFSPRVQKLLFLVRAIVVIGLSSFGFIRVRFRRVIGTVTKILLYINT